MVLSYFGLVFAFALSHHWQNCNYSKTNKAIFKFVWNFQETCETFFFLLNFFQEGELILPIPWRLGFKFEAKPEKSKKSKSWGILKFKMWSRNILENMLQKKLLLQKCHVRVILHFVIASEGYLLEKAIIELLEWFACFHSSLWKVILTWYQKHLFFGDIILVWKKNWRTNREYEVQLRVLII